jgi:aspartate aminotransferase
MAIAEKIKGSIEKSSWIRKMFEEGARLKAEFGEENVFDFSLGNPDVEPPLEFFEKLSEAANTKKKGIHGYMPNAGFTDARKSIADSVSKDNGIEIDFNSIVMSCGASGGLNSVFKAILNPEDEIIVPAPYFVEYGFYVSNHNGILKPVETNGDFTLNIENIKTALSEKTAAVLVNSPNNPTGVTYKAEEIKELSELLTEHNKKGRVVYLVSDEPYRDIVFDGVTVPSILNAYNHSITVTSYSKTLSLSGERIGYIAVNPKCDDYQNLMAGIILATRILGYVNAPALMQRIVSELTSVKVDVELYKKRRDMLAQVLQSAGYEFVNPTGGFYIFCKSPIEDDVAFVKHLQKYNILAVPGSGFAKAGYFRLCFCTSEKTISGSAAAFKKAIGEI